MKARFLSDEFPPLLVTLTMDENAFAHFNALRQRYFPPERNKIPAHITLFHALPGSERQSIEAVLMQCAANTAPFAVYTASVQLLGGGATAYLLDAPEAVRLRGALSKLWLDWLKPQDRQGNFRPHITVQNKVDVNTAQATARRLEQDFTAFAFMATGFDLWFYRGGPWEHLKFFHFKTIT